MPLAPLRSRILRPLSISAGLEPLAAQSIFDKNRHSGGGLEDKNDIRCGDSRGLGCPAGRVGVAQLGDTVAEVAQKSHRRGSVHCCAR